MTIFSLKINDFERNLLICQESMDELRTMTNRRAHQSLHRISAEEFEFKVKFATDLAGGSNVPHPMQRNYPTR